MSHSRSKQGIDCPVGLFGEVEREIADITVAINRAPSAVEKARSAAELRRAILPLLECKAYSKENGNCRLCREFAVLRDNTAKLVERTANLAN